jgi:hypothetical protein
VVYLRRDLHEIFQVTGYEERSGTIEIQTFDGDLDEIEEQNWRALRLHGGLALGCDGLVMGLASSE